MYDPRASPGSIARQGKAAVFKCTVKEIKESMIDPNGNRQLIRLTSDNIKADIDKIRATQSDLSSLFEDVDMSTYKF